MRKDRQPWRQTHTEAPLGFAKTERPMPTDGPFRETRHGNPAPIMGPVKWDNGLT